MKYIFAVSGGPDSMAMLDMYHKKAQAVCVVNYKKRKDSQKDVDIVVNYCNLHNIKCYVHNVTSNFYKKHKNYNFQALARSIRYDFFREIAKKEQNNHIFIAHNLNDHLETAYMQFMRNSKALFYGISRKNEYFELKITRPVLRFKKATLQRYCDQNNIKYALDYTNELDIYERNRVRKIINKWSNDELLEFVKKVNEYNKKHKKEHRLSKKYTQKWKKDSYSISFLLSLDKELQYYLLYNFLKDYDEKNNSSNKIHAIIDFLATSNPTKKYRLEQGKYLVKVNNYLKIINY